MKGEELAKKREEAERKVALLFVLSKSLISILFILRRGGEKLTRPMSSPSS